LGLGARNVFKAVARRAANSQLLIDALNVFEEPGVGG